MGNERTYDYVIALDSVIASDFMTAESADLLWKVLNTVTRRIVNEVKRVNRVLYDYTGKLLKEMINLRGHLYVLFFDKKLM